MCVRVRYEQVLWVLGFGLSQLVEFALFLSCNAAVNNWEKIIEAGQVISEFPVKKFRQNVNWDSRVSLGENRESSGFWAVEKGSAAGVVDQA